MTERLAQAGHGREPFTVSLEGFAHVIAEQPHPCLYVDVDVDGEQEHAPSSHPRHLAEASPHV
jgi:hypothetical protein